MSGVVVVVVVVAVVAVRDPPSDFVAWNGRPGWFNGHAQVAARAAVSMLYPCVRQTTIVSRCRVYVCGESATRGR